MYSVMYNRKKTTSNISTEPKPDLPRQFQHLLRCNTLNIGTNLCSQAVLNIVAQDMFNLLHALRI